MVKEKINSTDYANIYGLYTDQGVPVGTMEEVLAGRNAGTYYYSLSGKYTRKQIRTLFKQAKEGR